MLRAEPSPEHYYFNSLHWCLGCFPGTEESWLLDRGFILALAHAEEGCNACACKDTYIRQLEIPSKPPFVPSFLLFLHLSVSQSASAVTPRCSSLHPRPATCAHSPCTAGSSGTPGRAAPAAKLLILGGSGRAQPLGTGRTQGWTKLGAGTGLAEAGAG